MEKKVLFEQDQQLTNGDMNRLGEFPQEALDSLVREAIEPGLKYSGFVVIASGPAEVTIGTGAVWEDGRVFRNDDEGGVEIDMLANLPAIGNKYVAIVAFGEERDTEVEPRTFLLDPVTRATEARSVPTVRRRYALVDKVVGTESTSPIVPAVGARIVMLAYVLLSPTGIVSVTQVTDNKLSSGRNNANALLELALWRAQTGARLETIQTDVTGLSDNLRNTARTSTVLEIARDVAQLKSIANLPDEYSSYGFDPFLVLQQSNTDVSVVTGGATHPNLDCLVQEGIRFPPIATSYAQLNLLNTDDAKVRRQDNFIMPAFVEVERIRSVGRDDEISLSQYENQTVELVKKSVSRQRTRFGGYFTVCTNAAWWKSGKFDPVSGIFSIDGNNYEVDISPFQEGWVDLASNHTMLRLRQFWVDTINEPYWDAITTTESVNGSVIGQTFLNSQETWCTAVGVYFTRKGLANVTLALCETTEGGAPNPKKVVATSVVAPADMKIYPLETKVAFPLSLLERGKRYAIVPITTGAHYLALTVGNKFSQGSLFYSTDGSWFQGDLVRDMAFVIYAAKFASPRVEVQLEPWQLAGGIHSLDILADAIIPSGCSLTYDVKVNNEWVSLSAAALDALTSLPPLLQARAVFQGTTDLMPRLGVGSRAHVTAERPKQALTHITDVRTMPAPVNTVWVDVRLEAFDAAHNTAVVRLLSGAGYNTTTNAAVVETTLDADDPTTIIRRYIFTFAGPISSFKIRTEATTDSVHRMFHVAFESYVALNT